VGSHRLTRLSGRPRRNFNKQYEKSAERQVRFGGFSFGPNFDLAVVFMLKCMNGDE
jgi:hypothetical protein